MNRVASKLSTNAYRFIAKPVLFARSPDAVHRGLLRVGGFVQKSRGIRWLLASQWAYQNPQMLRQKILGVTFENPIGLSAGFDKNFELAPLLKSVGFGLMEGGSLTAEPCAGNKRPWFYRLPKTKSIVVHVGLANEGVQAIVERLRRYPKSLFADFPLNISVAKTNSSETCAEADGIADYVTSLKAIKKADVGQLLTINISCPNTFGGEPFTKPDMLGRLLVQIDALKLKQPLFIKMPSDLSWPELDALLRVASKHRVAGVTIGNLTKKRTKVHPGDTLPGAVEGGLSGKPTWEITNESIRRTYLAYGERFVIIGVGGVASAEDAYTKIKLGATLVELITGMIFEGPQLIGQINHGLVELLRRDGYTHISQAIGVDAGRR